jgi:porphobilinogen synthase
LFVKEGLDSAAPVKSMPGVVQDSLESVKDHAKKIQDLGIPSIFLFGIPESKDASGSQNFSESGIPLRAIEAIKKAAPELAVISDMCFCEYTDHGHCGVLNKDAEEKLKGVDENYIHNDETLQLLYKGAIAHANAGADVIAPSGSMDGMTEAIRTGLDESGFVNTPIFSYAVKYASSFYGPFRDAAEGAPAFGDRKQYQMDFRCAEEALIEAEQDIAEGADAIIVKPGMPYLDILTKLKSKSNVPLAAYQVSGEYAMLHAASQNGWLDLERTAMESLYAFKRAGASMIISYFAESFAEKL